MLLLSIGVCYGYVSVGVTPGSLLIDFHNRDLVKASIIVYNTGQTTASYRIYPSKDIVDVTSVSPMQLTLLPKQSKQVTLSFNKKETLPKEAYMYVEQLPNAMEELKVNGGIKLPVRFEFEQKEVAKPTTQTMRRVTGYTVAKVQRITPFLIALVCFICLIIITALGVYFLVGL
ncbi:hypothetical protein DRJ48_03735 [Candidatus Woesearchaeota archaeon]|nr:MAG: hypothetical protein DRJ48_03735 [Candidatus Woesearchaeota archaeon]